MFRHLRALALGLIAIGLLASCDNPGDSGSSNAANFQGTDSCPIDNNQPYSPNPPSTNGTPVGQSMPEMPHTHVNPGTTITYLNDPPTSGCHYNLGSGIAPIAPGAYDKVIAPEYWIHNLEHGYVAVLYNCPTSKTVPTGGCPSEFTKLRAWLRTVPAESDTNDPTKGCGQVFGKAYARIIIVPETTMKVKFAVVSWDWYLGMQTLDINQIQAFYANHSGQAPEKGAC